eukprot:TRINITY_DN9193_c0_g2_i1.p1 TRINITY_DN9193_c0_g2~~TRINITY_DN9193_c0_g2_i1.p1  ORF type:complete len:2481 (-),score=465.82 TRINITY_DN9193_c0_g2_i1:92-7534(-)
MKTFTPFVFYVVFIASSYYCGFVGWEYLPNFPSTAHFAYPELHNGVPFLLPQLADMEFENTNPTISYIWKLDPVSLNWTQVQTTGSFPLRRTYTCIDVYNDGEGNSKLHLFGGTVYGGQFENIIHTLDLNTMVWSQEQSSAPQPDPRIFPSCIRNKDEFFIYGGYSSTCFPDLWSYGFGDKKWKRLPSSTSSNGFTIAKTVVLDNKIYFYDCISCLLAPMESFWTYDIGKQTWQKFDLDLIPGIKGVKPIYSVFQNRFHIFGLGFDVLQRPTFSTLQIVDIESARTLEAGPIMPFYTRPSLSLIGEMPWFAEWASTVDNEGNIFAFNLKRECFSNEVWIFNLEQRKWVASSLSKYPVSRRHAQMHSVSNGLLVYGGEACLLSRLAINDLWYYNTENKAWNLLRPDEICMPENDNCGPPVLQAAVHVYQESIFVIGGHSSLAVFPVVKKYTLETNTWATLFPAIFDQDMPYRFATANALIGSTIYIFGGRDSRLDSAFPQTLITFDIISQRIDKFDFGVLNFTTVDLAGFNLDGRFCIMDMIRMATHGRMIRCLIFVTNTWEETASVPKEVGNNPSLLAYGKSLLVFGGLDESGSAIGSFWIYDDYTKHFGPIHGFEYSAKPRAYTSLSVNIGVLYLFGGDDPVAGSSNSLYRVKLNEMWCRGHSTVTSAAETLSDGSGSFGYLPGTSCSWLISETNYILISTVDIGKGASLILSQTNPCDDVMFVDGKETQEVDLSKLKAGTVIQIPSGSAKLNFHVTDDAEVGNGFEVILKECNKGLRMSPQGECVCEANNFLNFRKECIPCPSGSNQPLSNQSFCIKHETYQSPVAAFETVLQSQLKAISMNNPSSIGSLAASIDGSIALVGGNQDPNESLENYHPMNIVYLLEDPVLSNWRKVALSGSEPSTRTGGCFIGFEGYAIMFGGKTKTHDRGVYALELQQARWTRRKDAPTQFSDVMCSMTAAGSIVAYSAKESGAIYEYKPVEDTWIKRQTFSKAPSITEGGLVVHKNKAVVFGGVNQGLETDKAYSLDLESLLWSELGPFVWSSCLECDAEDKKCSFQRKSFAYGLIGSHIHVYGGSRDGEILADMVVLDIESMKVEERHNYGLDNPTLPLIHPGPKYGAAFCATNRHLVLIGGASTGGITGSDLWIWDAEIRTWSDTSLLRYPIQRAESSVAQFSAESFIVFGGATNYISEVLLNDLWLYNLTTQGWSRLFQETDAYDVPIPRASATLSVSHGRVYVAGGRVMHGMESDDNHIWEFNMLTKSWVVHKGDANIGQHQRPFSRIGAASVNIANKLWTWGGRLAGGLRRVEFYSAAFYGDFGSQDGIKPQRISDFIPSRRAYPIACSTEDGKVVMHGGQDFNGVDLSDTWSYDPENQTWSLISTGTGSNFEYKLSQGVCASWKDSIVVHGALNGKNVAFMYQKGVAEAIRLVTEDLALLANIRLHNALSFKGNMLMFGGSKGFSLSNQMVGYRPGLCRQTSVVDSRYTASQFDDGSASGYYLENTDCSWTLPNATYVHLNIKIRPLDHLSVFEINAAGTATKVLFESNGEKVDAVLLQSSTGFQIKLKSFGTGDIDEPCIGCDGFTATHAHCPSNSRLDSDTLQCQCEPGFKRTEDRCDKVPNDDGQVSMPIVLGVSLGSVCLLLCASGFALVYRKHVMKKVHKEQQRLVGAISFQDISLKRIIGSGSFGDVYCAEWRGTEVAVKMIGGNYANQKAVDALKAEIGIMVELRHPNILLYMGACFEMSNLCLVCEYMQQGSLYDILHKKERMIGISQKIEYALDIAKGMQYLHSSKPPIVHRDLKSLNILVDDRGRLKVCDFGLTTLQEQANGNSTQGSIIWLAPEVAQEQKYTIQADVYSYGIVLWEILTRQHPYEDVEASAAILCLVCFQKRRPKIPSDLDPDVQQLMEQCWSHEPHERPDFGEIISRLKDMQVSKSSSMQSSFMSLMDVYARELSGGDYYIVCSQVADSDLLWERSPNAMAEALSLHGSIVMKELYHFEGICLRSEAESLVVAFDKHELAIKFCMSVQESLHNETSALGLALPKYAEDSPENFKGLVVKMGMDFGRCERVSVELPNQLPFKGDPIHNAIRLCRVALPGQLLISQASQNNATASTTLDLISKTSRVLAEAKPLKTDEDIFQVVPFRLSGRLLYWSTRVNPPMLSLSSIKDPSKRSWSDLPSLNTSDTLKPQSIGLSPKEQSNTHQNLVVKDTKYSWQISANSFKISGTQIGTGSFGSVFIGEYEGRKVAVKKMLQQLSDASYIIEFMREVNMMRRMQHKNIIKFYGACLDTPNIAIIEELVNPGNLHRVLKNPMIDLSPASKRKIAVGIAEGMQYLHSQSPPVLHRDLKTANVLIDEEYDVRICDFGFARVKINHRTMTKCGTATHQAPEVLQGEHYDEKADVYSFGIVLWEIETRKNPYQGSDQMRVHLEVISGKRPPITRDMTEAFVSTMTKCWAADPSLRPTFPEIISLLCIENETKT